MGSENKNGNCKDCGGMNQAMIEQSMNSLVFNMVMRGTPQAQAIQEAKDILRNIRKASRELIREFENEPESPRAVEG